MRLKIQKNILSSYPHVELGQRYIWVDVVGGVALLPRENELLGGVSERLEVDLAELVVHREQVEVHRARDVVVETAEERG